MRELRRETQDREVGVRNVRNWGQTNAHQRVAPTEFSLFPTSRRY